MVVKKKKKKEESPGESLETAKPRNTEAVRREGRILNVDPRAFGTSEGVSKADLEASLADISKKRTFDALVKGGNIKTALEFQQGKFRRVEGNVFERIAQEERQTIGEERPQQQQKKKGFFSRLFSGEFTDISKITGEKVVGTPVAIGAGSAARGLTAAFEAGRAGQTGQASVAVTTFGHKIITTKQGAVKLVGVGASTTQRGFVGTTTQNTALANKLFRIDPLRGAVAGRYATNAKSTDATIRILAIAGFSLGAASILKDLIGTYPFAGFIKEEAIQSSDFAFRTAQQNNDREGMQASIAIREEILDIDAESNLLSKIPYANVQKNLQDYFEAARVKLETDKRFLQGQ